jgi:hypothetical protein
MYILYKHDAGIVLPELVETNMCGIPYSNPAYKSHTLIHENLGKGSFHILNVGVIGSDSKAYETKWHKFLLENINVQIKFLDMLNKFL